MQRLSRPQPFPSGTYHAFLQISQQLRQSVIGMGLQEPGVRLEEIEHAQFFLRRINDRLPTFVVIVSMTLWSFSLCSSK